MDWHCSRGPKTPMDEALQLRIYEDTIARQYEAIDSLHAELRHLKMKLAEEKQNGADIGAGID